MAAALLEEVLGRRSVCSRAMNYAVRRGLGPRTSAGRPEGGERRKGDGERPPCGYVDERKSETEEE